MDADSSNLQKLLDGVLAGDSDGLGALLEQSRPMLLHHLAGRLDGRIRRRLDPSDIVQQTCLEACRDFPRFQGSEVYQWLAWLTQILENRVIDARRQHEQAARRAVSNEASQADVHAAIAARATSASQRLMRRERNQGLKSALAQLPADQRRAIELRFGLEMTVAEIALDLARSDVAVAGLLKRGLKKLRMLLGDDSLFR